MSAISPFDPTATSSAPLQQLPPATSGNGNLFADQLAQMIAAGTQGQPGTNQTALTPSQAVLDSLDVQAAQALSQGNAPVVSTLETLIALQMNGVSQAPAAQPQPLPSADATTTPPAPAPKQAGQAAASKANTKFLPLGQSDPAEDYAISEQPNAPTEYMATSFNC